MAASRFTVTTAIHYVNGPPHLGHAYETLLADVLARAHRLRGDDTWFLTGTDEHGQKNQRAAEKAGVTPQVYCDGMVGKFRDLWRGLGIEPDDFIRTTEPRHQGVVRAVLADLHARGKIYSAPYEGLYCTADERFWTEKDIPDGRCPECRRPVERISERNYYFRMSQDQAWLVVEISEGRLRISPETRRNEVLGFLRKPLEDLCISRPRARVSWGIPLPFDESYVSYVWFDALLNYISAPGYGSDPKRFAERWPAQVHVIGKDILTPHAVYWPVMLHALGLALPEAVFAHNWWLLDDAKMSKSSGNVVDPAALALRHGAEALRYYLMREMPVGTDVQFSEAFFDKRYETDLADNLGNLLQRTTQMIVKSGHGTVPEAGPASADEGPLSEAGTALRARYDAALDRFDTQGMIACAMDLLSGANRYVERTTPWTLAKSPASAGRLKTVLSYLAEVLRLASAALEPVVPGTVQSIRERLGIGPDGARDLGWKPGRLAGAVVRHGTPLFPKRSP